MKYIVVKYLLIDYQYNILIFAKSLRYFSICMYFPSKLPVIKLDESSIHKIKYTNLIEKSYIRYTKIYYICG